MTGTKNVINGRKVCSASDIPFLGSLKGLSRQDYLWYGLDSVYRNMIARGQGASRKDPTWSKSLSIHTCCKSKYPWRHFKDCKKALRNCPDDLSDLKDI